MSTPGRSSVGASVPRLTLASFSMPSDRRGMIAGRSLAADLSVNLAADRNTCPSSAPKGLAEGGLEPPVGSVDDSFDNALTETINGLYKAEVIWRYGPWRSLDAVESATLEWVAWYNNRRLLQPISNIPPAEAEAADFAMLENQAVAA